MVTKVGKDVLRVKRKIKDLFPKEFTSRLLINQFMTYILDNFFEKSNEKIVSGYIGEVVKSNEGTECYITEGTVERQNNQIIPVITTTNSKITHENFLAELYNQGCLIKNQNKLLAEKHWSWCPPINADMFINFTSYYWIGYDKEESYIASGDDKNIFAKSMDVTEIIGKKSYTYKEYDEEGVETFSKKFKNGDRVVFLNDTSKLYCSIPFIVGGLTDDDNGYLTLTPTKMPMVVLKAATNLTNDALNKESYTYEDTESDIKFSFVNGMRVMFLNDSNSEYNNKIFMISGVGESISLINDEFNPFAKVDEDTYDEVAFKKNYFVMERGALDNNDWSRRNRWVSRQSLEVFNIDSINQGLVHASMPIICFNKDIELFNYGKFSRGDVIKVDDTNTVASLSGKTVSDFLTLTQLNMSEEELEGSNILFISKSSQTDLKQLYTISIIKSGKTKKILLQLNKNGQTNDGSTQINDCVTLVEDSVPTSYYYNGTEWVEGQTYEINRKPLFNLYDSDKVLLNNTVTYPSSTFAGCSLFEYTNGLHKENSTYSEELDMFVTYKNSTLNYLFNNTIETDSYYYTPSGDYEREFLGYRFYKFNGKDEYLNDWHLNDSEEQYIKTQVNVTKDNLIDVNGTTYCSIELAYTPSTTTLKAPLIVTVNGYTIDTTKYTLNTTTNTLLISDIKIDDNVVIQLITDEDYETLDSNYSYELPLSLRVNQLNEEIEEIAYNNCFDQMDEIIKNQQGFEGDSYGSNNYSSIKQDLSIGTKIVQNASSIIKTMILNNNEYSSIRSAIEYVQNAYTKYKDKFVNTLNTMYLKGEVLEESKETYLTAPYEMDSIITEIISRINLGKEGLKPFYNNGVINLVENAYIPATPAYLGMANCYEPRIETYTAYPKADKPEVIVGHDGSLFKTTGTVKDLVLLRFETLIYDSINTKFKDTKCGFDIHTVAPGRFRTGLYSYTDVADTYASLFTKWVINYNVDYSTHDNFEYDLTANPEAWKTWNYTGTSDVAGNALHGSYRSVYMYYYDTYRPDTHPWEMLGFGDKPSWWDDAYGEAPYTADNIILWKDLEAGYVRDGSKKGTYAEYARPGLVANYIPVDEDGNLKSPMDIGIIDTKPIIQTAKAKWVIGDIGEVELAYMQTSHYKYNEQIVQYLLKPLDWVELNWNTQDREVLFEGTSYEQIIDSTTNTREDISKIVLHNENDVRHIGLQQWISDYLVYNNIDISTVGDEIRSSNVCLGYRCSGYYQQGTLSVNTDSYGELPEDNVHLSLFKTKKAVCLTYSAIRIEKTNKGYIVDGFDKSNPYFKIRKPETNGKKSIVTISDKSVFYYHMYKEDIEKVPYRTEYKSIQDVYTFINAYSKYLEDNENWYYTSRTNDGVLSDFRLASETFVKWAVAKVGEDSNANMLLLNPGMIGIGNHTLGMVDDLGKKCNGYETLVDIYENGVNASDVNVIRQSFNTQIKSKGKKLALIKIRTMIYEHLLTLDNKTIYGDVLYDSKFSTMLARIHLHGVKVRNWYGDLYAPGYLLTDEGAIPNFDKKAGDLRYMFDVDNEHCQGEYAKYSKGIVGFQPNKTYKDLFRNDKSIFDFYKGVIREKGTKNVVNKINRSSYISSTGNNIELYENWAFKAGEFGHTSDNSILEFLLDPSKLKKNSMIVTFESASDYYYSTEKTYNKGDLVIYKEYEYVCKTDNVIGEFDESNWKNIRYVGNYIIFWDDPNWLKKNPNRTLNTFRYTNDFICNPIGGFAQTNDVQHIVADESELEELDADDTTKVSVGDFVWIAFADNGDWDIRKKTGEGRYVSMRYETVEDALNQEDYDYVYHFTDDQKDYYTTKNSEVIGTDLDTPLYSDIDLTTQDGKWSDIGSPIYTGETGTYVNGTDYKLKLYNTVFTTTISEDKINSNSVITELDKDVSLTYANLLLNMTQFGTTSYQYKWKFTLIADTRAPNVNITVNGKTYVEPTNNRVDIIVGEGEVLEWKITAFGCGERTGVVNVGYAEYDSVTGIKLKPLVVTVPLSYRDKIIVADTSTIHTSEVLPLVYDGTYELSMVGAGGGAGGGTYYQQKKKKWWKRALHAITAVVAGVVSAIFALATIVSPNIYDAGITYGTWKFADSQWDIYKKKYSWRIFPSGGCGAGSGAYLHAKMKVIDPSIASYNVTTWTANTPYSVGDKVKHDDTYYVCILANKDSLFTPSKWNYINGVDEKYRLCCGAGGAGGKLGSQQGLTPGQCGGDTFISKNGVVYICAQSGAGGPASKSAVVIQGNRLLGYGGLLQSTTSLTERDTQLMSDSMNGQDGNPIGYQGPVGQSVYPGGTYGKGGDWVYSGDGKAGNTGYVKIIYHAGTGYAEYSDTDITTSTVQYISKKVLKTDSMDYSSYYQPYVMKPEDDGTVNYFYSYDVIYDDHKRTDAEIVSPGSMFYKNRAKAVTAYHKSTITKNLWEANTSYVYGDMVTHYTEDNGKYYICVNDNTTSTWTLSEIIAYNWAANTSYVVGDKVKNDGVNYICINAHVSASSFNANNWDVYTPMIYWQEYAPTYYYKITYNHGPFDEYSATVTYNTGDKVIFTNSSNETLCYKCLADGVINIDPTDTSKWSNIPYPTEPTYTEDGYDYELYDDANCTTRAVKNNGTGTFMNCSDLDFSRSYKIGDNYSLVDSLGTYSEMQPIYISEPTWSAINQVGTYDITSGGIIYYVKMDKETTESDTTSKVYSDTICSTANVVKIVNAYIENNVLKYRYEDSYYTNYINVETDHYDVSYELKDNDLYLYAPKTINEIELTTPVYSEFELINEIGTYGDYIPTWEKKDFAPNSYDNTISYIKYEEPVDNSTAKIYQTTITDVDGNEVLAYYKVGNSYYRFCAPAMAGTTGLLDIEKTTTDTNKIKLYTKNGTTYTQITYDLYVTIDNTDKSTMYAVNTYKEDIINIDTYEESNNSNQSIKLYFNEQSVGKYVESNNLLLARDNSEEILFMFNNHEKDGFYQALVRYDYLHDQGSTPTDAIKQVLEEYVTGKSFIDADELNEFAKKYNYNNLATAYTSLDSFVIKHTCRTYNSYRNNNNERVYHKIYMLGSDIYMDRDVLDSDKQTTVKYAICCGTVDTYTSYTRTAQTYVATESYIVGDRCLYDDIDYVCIQATTGVFDEDCWEEYTIEKDTIVNVILYKEIGDLIYITHDSLTNANSTSSYNVSDDDNVSRIDGVVNRDSNKGWMKLEYTDSDYKFNVSTMERKRINIKDIKSCYLVDNDDDSTIAEVQLFDPIQNVIPNKVLDEVNYISNNDPVVDYTDSSKWNDQKIGYLWWDTSKVKYVDYYQGNYEYKRETWGKQLPGSEIVINEWTRSVTAPTDDIKYITRYKFNYETESIDTYYYYWTKNPSELPEVSFRKNTALAISTIINNPTTDNIVWMAPIDSNISGKKENTMLICNYNNVLTGQDAVLQINMDSDNDVLDHTEWVQVKENAENDIPEYLWTKMKDSLLGVKEIDGSLLPVPDTSLSKKDRIGISFRPRQTMFDNLYDARRNFIDVINDIFNSREIETTDGDLNSSIIDLTEVPTGYIDTAATKLEMMNWRDEGLIGKNILVEHDESHDNIWAIYQINSDWTYTLIDYQKYDINNYLTYNDWYYNEDVKYITPTYTSKVSEMDAINKLKTLTEGSITKYESEDGWKLYQLVDNEGTCQLVGRSNALLYISKDIYDYVNQDLDNTEPYIETPTVTLTKYQYVYNETQYLLGQLIDYFDV